MSERTVSARYYTCNCEWTSKYCDEYHTAVEMVPARFLLYGSSTPAGSGDGERDTDG